MKKWLLSVFMIGMISTVMAQKNCSDQRNPLILVHGFLSAGDTWATQVKRFIDNGYCRERIFVFDWNTVGGNRKQIDSLLDMWVDSARTVCQANQVDLAGHSAGGGLCTAYLSDSLHSLKVAHYIHIGSGPVKGPAGFKGAVPTRVISSRSDKVLGALKEVPGVSNIVLENPDHAEVQTCEETFNSVFSFLNQGKSPDEKELRLPKNVTMSGRVVYFGDNTPVQTDSILLYYFDPITGKRKQNNPVRVIRSDNNGYWASGPIPSGHALEFEVHPPFGRVISYYLFRPLNSNDLVYLRCIPPGGLISGVFKKIPADSTLSALAVFTPDQAIIAGRDSLVYNGTLLSTEELTPASKTVLACFIFDAGSGAETPRPVKGFGTGVFLTGIDKKIPAGKERTQLIQFNQQSMTLPCRPSSEALMVAIFR